MTHPIVPVELPHPASDHLAARRRGAGAIKPRELPWRSPRRGGEQAKIRQVLGERGVFENSDGRGASSLALDVAESRAHRPGARRSRSPGPARTALDSAGTSASLASVKLSIRLPPTLDGAKAGEFVKELLEKDPLRRQGAIRSREVDGRMERTRALGVARAFGRRGIAYVFRRPTGVQRRGGSIPFMGMLGEKFAARAQFSITACSDRTPTRMGPKSFLPSLRQEALDVRRQVVAITTIREGEGSR